MNRFRFFMLLTLYVAHSAAARAETDKGQGVGSVSAGTTPLDIVALPDDADEIVVTAERRGEAKVSAETEFSEEEIASHGVDSIQGLLTRLAPFIDGSGEELVILINGKPAGFDRSILSYPAEALDRLAVLKPEAATQYGEAAGKRVVNLVLKKNFSMLNADASIDFATGGGQYGGKLSANRTAISGETRWNARAQVGADSAFPKAARNLPPREGVFDNVGFVSASDGGEIDPALSFAAGQIVTVAGIPSEALSGMAALSDFAATANIVHAVDPNRFETLQSSRRNASLGIGVTRPIGDFSASLNVNASRSSSEGRRGLPMASVLIPEAYPGSPFASDVLLTRPLAGERALRTENGATSLSSSLTVNGKIGDWQTSIGVNYSWNRSRNLLENGIDVGKVQALIDAADPTFNPFGSWDDGLLLANQNRTKGQNLSARLNVRKTIIELPAGPLAWNITANTSRNSTQSWRSDSEGDVIATSRISRRQSSGQMALSVPITRRGEAGPAWLGDMTLNLTASAQTMTNSRAQKRYGGNVSWSPWSIVQLRGSIDYTEAAPSFDQLDAPIVTTVNRVFDYARQEIADPIWTTGGNPDLGRGSRQSMSLAATVRPLGGQSLTLNLGYRQSVAKGGISAFPELIPVIEAAFPERVTRDADGRLVAVDARAINIAHDTDANLTSGIALRLPGRGNVKLKDGRQNSASVDDPLQFSVSLNHRWRLKSELLTRTGVPVIDQLSDSGQSRHSLSLQATVGKRGIGANLSGNWSNSARLRRDATDTDEFFIFKPPLTINVSTFVEPDRLLDLPKAKGVLNGLKVSIDIQNLFNGYRRVTLDDGSIPSGYSRDEVDPLGRTVRISLRKKF